MSAHALPSPFDGKEIWFLTGSQDLYGEETLARVAEQSRQVAAWLDEAEAVPVPIVWKPVELLTIDIWTENYRRVQTNKKP